MTTRTDDPVDLGWVLGEDGAASDALHARLATTDDVARALDGLPATTRGPAAAALAGSVADLLDTPLSSVLGRAWRTHADLTGAGRRTAQTPGTREVVELASHECGWERSPTVTLLLGDTPLLVLVLTVSVNLEIQTMVAEVVAGRLTAIRSGRCEVSVDVVGSVRGGGPPAPLLHAARTLDLALDLPLGDGLLLVGPAPR